MAEQGGRRWVLDTKWKRLDAALGNSRDKYGLSQADFYQLFAYGHHYLQGAGELLLVYPKTASLRHVLPRFDYSDTLRLWVVPFDLEQGCMEDGVLMGHGDSAAVA